MRSRVAFVAVVGGLMWAGCGKSDAGLGGSAAAASPAAAFVGTWKSDKEAVHKILMAKLQRETPNMPYEEMEKSITDTTVGVVDGLTIDLRDGGTAHFHQGEHDGNGSWKLDGQTLLLTGPNRPEPATGTLADGILTLKHNDHVEMVLIKG